MNYCEDCGCKIINGHCVNCHEEVFIVEQYNELDMELPDDNIEFMQKYHEQIKD